MITETSKHPIPGISQEALVRAAALAETDTRIGRWITQDDVEIIEQVSRLFWLGNLSVF